jgi:hypothetical protein
MSKLKIVTQTDNIEGKGTKTVLDNWMDDCAWATLACAANYLTGSKYTSFDAVKWGEKVGRKDRDGLPDPTSLDQGLIMKLPDKYLRGHATLMRFALSMDTSNNGPTRFYVHGSSLEAVLHSRN